MVRSNATKHFQRIRLCKPSQPAYHHPANQPNKKKWNNFGNACPIWLKFEIEVHKSKIYYHITFNSNLTIQTSLTPSQPTSQIGRNEVTLIILVRLD